MTYKERVVLALGNADGRQLSSARLATMMGVSRSSILNKQCGLRKALDLLEEESVVAKVRGGYRLLGSQPKASAHTLPPVGTSGPITEVLPMLAETIKTLYPVLLPVYKAEMTKCSITEHGVELNVSASAAESLKDKIYDGMAAVLGRVIGPNHGLRIEYKSVAAEKKEQPKTSMTLAQELKSVLSRHLGVTLGEMDSFSVRLEGWKVMFEKDDPNAPKFFRQNNFKQRF